MKLHGREVRGRCVLLSCNSILLIKYFNWHGSWYKTLIYKKVVEVCHICKVWGRWDCYQEFFKRYLGLTYFFIVPPNYLKSVESYSFITRWDKKKPSTNKPMDMQCLFCLKEHCASWWAYLQWHSDRLCDCVITSCFLKVIETRSDSDCCQIHRAILAYSVTYVKAVVLQVFFVLCYSIFKSMLNDNLNIGHQNECTNILKKSRRMARMYGFKPWILWWSL